MDSSDSCLILQKQSSTMTFLKDELTVGEVLRMHLPYAQLAYLSACSTAENSIVELVDEVIHMVNGFQVAGFAHVVGSMWPSVDSGCVIVAKTFYESLCRRALTMFRDDTVANSLHLAVIKARETWWERPLAWAQYVRFGA